MSDLVTLTIDGVEVSVPKGTLVVDAAKKVDIDIPVFCYHPKMKPVGMCRMCLVDIGTPMRDRETGDIVTEEDGSPKIRFFPVLQTGCTVEVSEGMVVRASSQKVSDARDDIIEFLLTSHPLDCPICDKGGECPLQNLTMLHGRGTSRFNFEDKLKLGKNIPLGELIYLDRERCIQCARCTRFQSEIVDDPVIAFHNRGRHLEIVTMSEPGFDSIWSGNTTDICPVGALTTADFRFGARPWELTPVASICPHCPVGCNTTMSTRQEAKSGGRTVIKRILPRQNEQVNEIWICDKGRFVHHFADSPQRLTHPLIRNGQGQLVETTWEEALDLVAGKLQMAKETAAGIANDRLSNEDLFSFQKLFRQGLGNGNVDLAERPLGGAGVVAKVGLSKGSNIGELGRGDAILVVASDLHQEAPVWWLRVKQAAERGASLVVLNLRPTRLDKYATHLLQCKPGQTLSVAHKMVNAAKVAADGAKDDILQAAANALIEAENLVVFYGFEGLHFEETEILARLLGNLLLLKQMDGPEGIYHAGRPNNGLVPVWPHANTQGAADMGIGPEFGPGDVDQEERGLKAAEIYQGAADGTLKALYLVGADPVKDGTMADRGGLDFLVVQELFMTETALQADVVLPAQSWAEREGTYTTGERRVQRFYPAIPVVGQSRPDWLILAQIGERVGLDKPSFAASLLFRKITSEVPLYEGMDYRTLARTEPQWPRVGGDDLYYGGTSYKNESGLGQQWPVTAESERIEPFELPEIVPINEDGLVAVRIAALYGHSTLVEQTQMLSARIVKPEIIINPDDAGNRGIEYGDMVMVHPDGSPFRVRAKLDNRVPAGLVLIRGVNGFSGRAAVVLEREVRESVEVVA